MVPRASIPFSSIPFRVSTPFTALHIDTHTHIPPSSIYWLASSSSFLLRMLVSVPLPKRELMTPIVQDFFQGATEF